MKKELKYRTFDELLDSVKIDLPGIDIENQIEAQQLIKRALFINKELGVKLNPRKTALIEIDRGIGKLPYDFSSASFAVLCTDKSSTDISHVKQTDTREDFGSVMTTPDAQDGLGSKSNIAHVSFDSHNHPEVRYADSRKEHRYKRLVPLNFVRHIKVAPDCPNLNTNSIYSVSIKDNFLHANFQDGTVYLEYVSLMEDDRGQLLVLDHEFVNDYYEYQIKDTIFENMFLNGEPNLERKMQLIAVKLDSARTAALSFVRTPDFKEFQKKQEMNRKAMYHRYYNMFI